MKTLIDNPGLSDRLDSFVSENIHVAETILTQNRTSLPQSTLFETIELFEEIKRNSSKPLAEDLSLVTALLSNHHILSHLGISVE